MSHVILAGSNFFSDSFDNSSGHVWSARCLTRSFHQNDHDRSLLNSRSTRSAARSSGSADRGLPVIRARLSVGSAPTGRHYDSQGQSASVAPGRPTPLLPSPERAEEPLDPPSVMPPRWGLTGDALGFPGFRLSALPWAIAFRPCRGCSCLTWRVWGFRSCESFRGPASRCQWCKNLAHL
jgi:hypothetical protein